MGFGLWDAGLGVLGLRVLELKPKAILSCVQHSAAHDGLRHLRHLWRLRPSHCLLTKENECDVIFVRAKQQHCSGSFSLSQADAGLPRGGTKRSAGP